MGEFHNMPCARCGGSGAMGLFGGLKPFGVLTQKCVRCHGTGNALEELVEVKVECLSQASAEGGEGKEKPLSPASPNRLSEATGGEELWSGYSLGEGELFEEKALEEDTACAAASLGFEPGYRASAPSLVRTISPSIVYAPTPEPSPAACESAHVTHVADLYPADIDDQETMQTFGASPPCSPECPAQSVAATEINLKQCGQTTLQRSPPIADEVAQPFQGARCVCLHDIPCNLTRDDIKDLLDEKQCHYSFIYVPVDFAAAHKKSSNKGVAFVVLSSPGEASRVVEELQGFEFSTWKKHSTNSKKKCTVREALRGKIFGKAHMERCEDNITLEEVIAHFRDNDIMHAAVPERCQPAMYEGQPGKMTRVVFPSPTGARLLKMPGKLKHSKVRNDL